MSFGAGGGPPQDPWAAPGSSVPPPSYPPPQPYAPAPGYYPPAAYYPLPPPAAPRPPRPPGKRGWVVTLVALFCVAALVVVAAGAYVGGQLAKSAKTDAAEKASVAAARVKIEAELPRLTAFVATDRGHAWKTQPTAEVLSDDDFVKALQGGGGSDGYDYQADPDDQATTFTALGLVDSPDDFDQAQASADDANVIGFYDSQTTRLVVRGTAWTPSMEYTLVHELTHALQDQTFDLSALQKSVRYDDETALALQSVVEGDAERVADDYYDEQTQAWQDSVDNAQSGGSASAVPVVDTIDGLPYVVGETFVDALFSAGGNAAVDHAFKAPPTTSQQLLQPQKWLAGTVPAPARPPWPAKPDGDLADRGVLGVAGFWMTVDGADPHVAQATALEGWAGDAYVSTSRDDGSSCIVDDATFIDSAARDQAEEFLAPWVKAEKIQIQDVGTTGFHFEHCHG
jgi:hypothetical protein